METTSVQPTAASKPWGLLAEYADATALVAAAAKVRDAGYRQWDCYTPFPVHGLDQAMGIRRTVLPWLVLGAGMTGCAVAILMQWYVNAPRMMTSESGVLSSYPLVFGGKPYWSVPAHIPIAFELTVLFAALTAFFGFWGLVRLPRLYFPAFANRRFRKVTNNGFFLAIQSSDEKFEPTATAVLLRETGSLTVEEIKEEDEGSGFGVQGSGPEGGPHPSSGHERSTSTP